MSNHKQLIRIYEFMEAVELLNESQIKKVTDLCYK